MDTSKIQIIRNDITMWFSGNRKGDKQSLPCYWTLYPLTSISQTPTKNTPYRCENYEYVDLESSIEFLMEQMQSSRTTKFFGVRLREGEKKVGITNNFINPYYENVSSSSIGSLSSVNNLGNLDFIGVLREVFSEKDKVRESQAKQEMAKMKAEMDTKIEMILLQQKHQDEVRELKAEVAGLRNGGDNTLMEFIKELRPAIGDVIRHKFIGNSPSSMYEEDGEQVADHEEAPEESSRNQAYLEQGIEMMRDGKIRHPEELVFKIATVIKYSTEQKVKMLLSIVQEKYKEVVKKLENEQQ